MRDAPSREIIRHLLKAGASVTAYDPVATHEAQRVLAQDLADQPGWLDRVSYAGTPDAALVGADALVIATEWKVFRSPDFAVLRRELKQPVVFDGRNLYSPQRMRDEGFEYQAIGRSMVL
jgi:UDPglucose 6-dehydrogenase